ncbi:MAG: type II toxin-antitoxin system VapC family toxin [Dehalococcoidia bacterium]|nr:type II toxin-antitoxin system VapC family toxin [Dehalococcoidia bacterium]
MMYLLDTDVVSSLLKRVPSTTLIGKLASVLPEQQSTTSITVGELVYGAHKAQERTDAVLEQMDKRILPDLPVLPFDAGAARRYGELRAWLERQGMSLGEADLRIAAIALSRGLTVVTGNVRHFSRIPGLPVENWFLEPGSL